MEEEVVVPAVESSAPEAPSETPAVEPQQDVPASEQPAVEPQGIPSETQSEPTTSQELYELPDGRKVDAKTLEHEFKNNFMPDYTRKSQIVAQVTKQASPAQAQQQSNQINEQQQNTPPWRDPNWVPQTYSEILEAAKYEVKAEQVQEQTIREQQQAQVNQYVDMQLNEIRKQEPNLSEELLFHHATKYGFTDLRTAYQNMKDFDIAVRRTQERTVKNIQNRADTPIAVQTQQQGSSNEIDYNSITNDYRSPIDILKSLKGK